jgi:hypothetical protein
MTVLSDTGRWLREATDDAGFGVHLLLRTAASMWYLPRRLRFLLDHAYAAGVRALPVTMGSRWTR